MTDQALNRIVLQNDPDVGNRYPLHKVTEEQVRAFWAARCLPIEVDVLVRGFLAFRHRAYIEEQFGSFDDEEREPLSLKIGEHEFTRMELQTLWRFWRRGKWQTLRHMSRLHWLLIAGCIFAAMTQGWDQAAMAGAAVQALKTFNRAVTQTKPGGSSKADSNSDNVNLDPNTWLLGFLVGIPFLFGAPIGLLITDRLTEIWVFGRRGAICVASLFSFISVIGSASVHNVNDFIGFRILLGAGMAGKASIVPIILSETSAKNVRGVLLVCWQLSVAFGLAAGSVANLSVYHLDVQQSWRYMFIAAFIPALILFSLVLFAPESPRWLLKKSGLRPQPAKDDKRNSDERVQDALRSLIELHNEPTNILAAGELILLYTRLVTEQELFADGKKNPDPLGTPIAHVTWRYRWSLMISKGPMRRANYAAASVMIAQQLCGINLLAFLADNFFRNSFFSQTDPNSGQNSQLLAFSMGFGVWNFVSTIPALFFIDNSSDRRRLLNWSFPLMSISLLVSGLILLSPSKTIIDGEQIRHETRPVVAAMHFIFLATFIAAYSVGEGPAAFVISAEVFPLVNRELGMSLAVFWNFLFAGLLALLAPALTKYITQTGILGLFSGLNLIAWAFCNWLVPNTGNEELEDVFRQFDVPTRFALVHTCVIWMHKAARAMAFLFCLRSHSKEAVTFGGLHNEGRMAVPATKMSSLPEVVDSIWSHLPVPYVERATPEGKRRARWRCCCGTQLYDDFLELTPGAVINLENELRSAVAAQDAANDRKDTRKSSVRVTMPFRRLLQPLRASQTSISPPVLPSYGLPAIIDGMAQENVLSGNPGLNLLSCVDQGASMTVLQHQRFRQTTKDYELFTKLKAQYSELKRGRSWITFQYVKTIRLSQFKVDFSNTTDVYKHENTCMTTSHQDDRDAALLCSCLPPREKIDVEYLCYPAPVVQLKVLPAIGQNRLTHYFQHPECISREQSTIFAQLPKRLAQLGDLRASPSTEEIGWGIHIEQGLHWRTVHFIAIIATILSLAFGVIWSVVRSDIQGGFAVSGCIFTLIGIMVGTLSYIYPV